MFKNIMLKQQQEGDLEKKEETFQNNVPEWQKWKLKINSFKQIAEDIGKLEIIVNPTQKICQVYQKYKKNQSLQTRLIKYLDQASIKQFHKFIFSLKIQVQLYSKSSFRVKKEIVQLLKSLYKKIMKLNNAKFFQESRVSLKQLINNSLFQQMNVLQRIQMEQKIRAKYIVDQLFGASVINGKYFYQKFKENYNIILFVKHLKRLSIAQLQRATLHFKSNQICLKENGQFQIADWYNNLLQQMQQILKQKYLNKEKIDQIQVKKEKRWWKLF